MTARSRRTWTGRLAPPSCTAGLWPDTGGRRCPRTREVNAVRPFREGNGRARRAFFDQLASNAGFILNRQHLDADRNIAASAAIMHGDQAPMRKMLDELIQEP
jgi:fido (protein-threonine AMPylation protein)